MKSTSSRKKAKKGKIQVIILQKNNKIVYDF